MVKIDIFTPDVGAFISLLEQQTNITWKKIWSINGNTIGVFFITVSPSSISSNFGLLNVVIEHNHEERYCQIWIESFGSGYYSPDRSKKELIHDIGNIAMRNAWRFECVPTTYRGDTCPSCKATYQYKEDMNPHSSLRNCQNCGKQFDPDRATQTTIERKDSWTRATSCPYCQATYTYRQKHILDDGTVVCQNCGEPFVLQIDEWTRYSYDWYQEETSQ